MTEESGVVAAPVEHKLGTSVPNEVMAYVHAYGDSRADDDGLSALRIGEAVLALRRWAAQLQAAERERCAHIVETQDTYGDPVGCWLETLAAKIRA